jgi:hypothetical protein
MDRLSLHKPLWKPTNQEAKKPKRSLPKCSLPMCSLPMCSLPKSLLFARMHKRSQPQGVWNWMEDLLEFERR